MAWYQEPTPVQVEFARRRRRQWLISAPFLVGVGLLAVMPAAFGSCGGAMIGAWLGHHFGASPAAVSEARTA